MTTASSPRQTGYYTVGKTGEQKTTPRIWLQGTNLIDSRFTTRCFYHVVFDLNEGVIILRVTTEPDQNARVVSGRKKADGSYTPIIDLESLSLLDITKDAEKVRAEFFEGEIRISVHHLDEKRAERESRLKKHVAEGYVTKGVLCCGIGMSTAAIHDGLEEAGIHARTQFIVDRERKYLDVAVQNNHAVSASTAIFEASLEEIEPELLGHVDILTFSLPCTGHSPAGKAKNKIVHAEEHATDAMAFLGLMRVIDACQPSILISENVLSARNSTTYFLIKGMLHACGYHVEECNLDASHTNSMEDRHRYWFVATSKGLARANLSEFPSFPRQYETLSDLLEDIPLSHPMWKSTKEKERKAALNYENGKNFGFNLIDGSVKSIGVCGKGYQKDRASEPHVAGAEKMMRLLTVRELCLSQSAPLHLVNNVVDGTAYEGLGQGIDYRQGVGIAKIVARDVLRPLIRRVGSIIQSCRTASKELLKPAKTQTASQSESQLALF